MGNNSTVEVISIGDFRLYFRGSSSTVLHDLLHVLGIRHNLFSVSKLLDLGLCIDFGQNNVIITFDFDKQLVKFCYNGLFCLDSNTTSGFANKRYSYSANSMCVDNDYHLVY